MFKETLYIYKYTQPLKSLLLWVTITAAWKCVKALIAFLHKNSEGNTVWKETIETTLKNSDTSDE